MGPRAKRCQTTRTADIIQKNLPPSEKCIPQQDTIFNMKQEENETLDEYWKRLVDIEKKCDFNNVTQEEIITYKFAATIKDKKARGNFIKGPLKIQLVLETIELDNYNRKYGDKKLKIKKAKRDSTSSSTSSEQVGHTNQLRKRKTHFNEKRKTSNKNCRFSGKPNWSMEHVCPARRSQCNNCKKMGHFAKVCKSKTVSRITEAVSSAATPNHGQKLITFSPSTVLIEWIFTKQSYWSMDNQ